MTARIIGALLALASAICACASLFFCYYTLRLAYLASSGSIDAAHRTAGLGIGAAVFPVASFCFGWLGLLCAKSAKRRIHSPAMAVRTRKGIQFERGLDP